MPLNLPLLRLFALFELPLGLLLIENVGKEHLRFESLDHVLLFVHVVVGLLDLLSPQLVLVALLLSVYAPALNL